MPISHLPLAMRPKRSDGKAGNEEKMLVEIEGQEFFIEKQATTMFEYERGSLGGMSDEHVISQINIQNSKAEQTADAIGIVCANKKSAMWAAVAQSLIVPSAAEELMMNADGRDIVSDQWGPQ